MRKKRTILWLGMFVVFFLVDVLFFWNMVQEGLFVSHMQETTGTVIHEEEETNYWGTEKECEFSYTVDGVHYKGTFTYVYRGISPEITLGKQIPVTYLGGDPGNARQGSVVRIIGIFVLKCSVYIFIHLIIVVGWMLRMTIGYRTSITVLS